MKALGKKLSIFMISLLMVFTSMTQYVSAKPLPNEPKREYDIQYLTGTEDENGFNAQFKITNLTDKVMVGWTFDFDYDMPLELSDDIQISSNEYSSNSQYKYHYQLQGTDATRSIAPNSELIIKYHVNAPRDANMNPQNYDFKYSIQPENPFVPSESTAYTRQEWIADLMEVAEFSYSSTNITSTYIDVLADNPYLNAIEMALNHGIITTDETGTIVENETEINGSVFHPNSVTDREFAILTSLKVLGYMNIDTPMQQFNVAKNIELFDIENNGKTFTTNEAKIMLEAVKKIQDGSKLEDGFESDIDIKEEVITLSQEDLGTIDYEFQDGISAQNDQKGILKLPNTVSTRVLKENDVIILPANESFITDVAQKIEKIIEINEKQIIFSTIAPDFSEVVGAGGVKVKGSSLVDFSTFEPADGIGFTQEGEVQTFAGEPGIKVEIIDGKLVTTFKNGDTDDRIETDGVLTLEMPRVTVDADIDPGFLGFGAEINKLLIKLDASASSSIKLKSNLIDNDGGVGDNKDKLLLGDMDLPIVGYGLSANFKFYYVVEISGEVTLTYTSSLSSGVEYTATNGFRNFNSASSNIEVIPLEISGNTGPALYASLNFLGFANIGDIEATMGAGFKASASNRENSSKCIDASLYLMLRLTAFSKKSVVGKYLGLTIIKNVFDKNNSPFRANIHFEYTPTHNGKVPNCTFGKANFKGKVVDFNNNNGIPMKFYANRGNSVNGQDIEISSPKGYIEGNDLSSGEYVFTITSPGYKAYTGRMTIRAGAENDIGTIKLVKEGTGSLTGKVTSAMNGNNIAGANLTLFNGADIEQTNESTTNKVSFEGDKTTNSSGSYNITVANGYYTLKLEKTGYETSYTNVTISNGNQTNNITLVPSGEIEGTDIGDLRIVLTWGATPSDLDSHLLGPTANGVRRFHTYFSNKAYNENGKRHAFLDIDDTSSYGPETTTIYNMNTSGKYSFYVQDFSNRNSMLSKALSSSDATVKVYKKESKNNADGEPTYVSKLIATYNIPKNTEGTVWHVFDYNALAEEITSRNTLTYTSNPGDVGTYLLDDKLDDTQINDIRTITNDFQEKIEDGK